MLRLKFKGCTLTDLTDKKQIDAVYMDLQMGVPSVYDLLRERQNSRKK